MIRVPHRITPAAGPGAGWRLVAAAVIMLLFIHCSGDKLSDIDLSSYKTEPGFVLQVVAAEPLIQAPVALQFDASGRLWVLEMPGYMPDLDGNGEDAPIGRLLILSDRDGDGQMDDSRVFLDSLVLPRAFALVYGGVLYAEPPCLWFRPIEKGDRPGPKTLVDSAYATGGNVEHQANGLLLNIDNWIYSAKSDVRYRRDVQGRWLKQKTAFRGQWGITHDDIGRLLYNDNSNQLYGDYFLPNIADHYAALSGCPAISQTIVDDQRVYPLHATAVNRGYAEGMLDSTRKLLRFTAACAPVVYRGHIFPADYQGNVFVCGPEANLVKRNIVYANGNKIEGKQALHDREFLASSDEAFRPVALCNAPDGALYIADMHRGIIQHRSYMTAYLREQLSARRLDTVVAQGRILRVIPRVQRQPVPVVATANDIELIEYLAHPNGWVRDMAQQRIVEERSELVASRLKTLLRNAGNPLQKIHALWCLEGMEHLNINDIRSILADPDPRVQASGWHLLSLMEIQAVELRDLQELSMSHASPTAEPYRAFWLGKNAARDTQLVYSELRRMLENAPTDTLLTEMALAGLSDKASDFARFFKTGNYLKTRALQMDQNRKAVQQRAVSAIRKGDDMTHGLELYRSLCSGCHGSGGEGIPNLAPPLMHAELVSECPEKVALVVLHGLKGPVRILGKEYNFASSMPAFKDNKALDDAELAVLVSFVRNAFAVKPSGIHAEAIGRLRKKAPRGDAFLEQELNCY